MEVKKRCFGYAVECPLKISFYYGENLDRCEISEKCYKTWIEMNGILGWEGVEKYNEKPWYEQE